MTTNPQNGPALASHVWHPQKSRRGISIIEVFAIAGILGLIVAALFPVSRTARGPATRRAQCTANIKQIALALLQYESAHNGLPPAYTVDADGKPLHSWRVLILPYLERNDLYKQIDFSKPWNDPANEQAYNAAMPDAYRCLEPDCPTNFTTYLAIVAPNGCFRSEKSRRLSEITDDHAETLMAIEVAAEHAVHWMAPTDADEPLVMVFGPHLPHTFGINAAFVDGSVRRLEADMPAAERQSLISIAGNDDCKK